jgi:hypothetical protein
MSSGTGEDLWGVWAFSPDLASAAGRSGAIVRWDGSAWSPVAIDTNLGFFGVSGTRPSDVWAVGERGNIAHWDGETWAVIPS